MLALEESMDKYEGRSELWLAEVKKLLKETESGDSMCKQMVKKIRSCLGPYNAQAFTNLFIHPNNKGFKAYWEKAERIFMTVILQHYNLADKATSSFMDLPEDKVKEIKNRLTENQPENMLNEETIVFNFMQIRKKADDLLGWMKDRVQP